MTTISTGVIDKLNTLFGSPAQPHFAAYSETTPTGCWYWSVAARYERAAQVQVIDTWLERARAAVQHEPVQVYKRTQWWINLRTTDSSQIVVCPGRDQFDIIRYDWGAKAGVECEVDYLAEFLATLDRQYGLGIVGAGYQTIEFMLQRVPQGAEGKALIHELYRLTNTVLEGIMNLNYEVDWEHASPMAVLDGYDLGDGRIALWFD